MLSNNLQLLRNESISNNIQKEDKLMNESDNESMTTGLVEQPLALTGSAKKGNNKKDSVSPNNSGRCQTGN